MIKAENKVVYINVDNRCELMEGFVNIVRAVRETIKNDDPEANAEEIIMGAVTVALDLGEDFFKGETEEDTETENETSEQDETPVAVVEIKLPEELNDAMDKVIKNIFGEEFLNGMKKKVGDKKWQ